MSMDRAALLVLVLFITNSFGAWHDCGSTLSQRLIRFNTFSAFPSPAVPGQYVHLRATYQAYVQLNSSAIIEMDASYGGVSVLNVQNIPFCNFTASYSCPVAATPNFTNALSFDYLVPEFAYGDYLLTFKISDPSRASAYGCLAFNITIDNPSVAQAELFTSTYQAQLEGTAAFSVADYTSRPVGSFIQIGPIGYLNAPTLAYGTFDSVLGTADVVPPSFDPTNYLWGLYGILQTVNTNANGDISHQYTGSFYVGYSGPYGSFNTADHFLTQGNFSLDHHFYSSSNYTFSGQLVFYPIGGSFPAGWFNPINLARLNPSYLETTSSGKLVAGASVPFCRSVPSQPFCPAAAQINTSPPADDRGRKLGIGLGVGLGILFLILVGLLILLLIIWRRRRTTRSEDTVYNPRPMEYGSALVVDDILQKSRVHSGAQLPILDHAGKAFPPAYLDNYPIQEPVRQRTSRPRDSRRESRRDRPRSERRSGRPQSERRDARRPYDSSDDEPLQDGRATSRSRSPRNVRDSRSSSPASRSGRSRSASPSDRGSGSPRASGSSRSRSPSSGSEGPRH